MKKPTTAKAAQAATTAAAQTSAENANGKGQSPAQPADQLLKADHRKVEQLFRQYEDLTDSSAKATCVAKICKELIVHAQLEEEIFYPACRQKGVKSDMLDEAQVEHDGAKVMIRELMSEDPEADYYDAKVTVLSEYIKHHVGEEEKGSEGIFALAKMAGVDMSALGSELQARKAELAQEFDDEPPAPEFRSLQTLESTHSSRQENRMPSRYESEGRGYSNRSGRSSGGRERDEHGRYTSGDDDRGYSRSHSSSRSRYDEDDDRRGGYGSRSASNDRERDEYGRFTSDDDNGGYRGRSSGNRDRDEYGRYTSHDDRGYGSSRGRSSDYDDDDRRGYGGRSSSYGRHEDDEGYRGSYGTYGSHGRSRYEDDDRDHEQGRSHGQGQGQGQGWHGDSEGHAEAARRGWEHRGGSGRSYGAGRYDDDDRRGSHSMSNRSGGGRNQSSHGGWFGDSEGHSEAARRGWRNRD